MVCVSAVPGKATGKCHPSAACAVQLSLMMMCRAILVLPSARCLPDSPAMNLRVSSLPLLCVVLFWTASAVVLADTASNTGPPQPRLGRRLIRVSDANGMTEYEVPVKNRAERWADLRANLPAAEDDKKGANMNGLKAKPGVEKQFAEPVQRKRGSEKEASEAGADAETLPRVDDTLLPTSSKQLEVHLGDGRKLPFSVPLSIWPKKRQKMVDESVDAHSTLRNMGVIEDRFSGGQYSSQSWEGGFRATLASENNAAFSELLDWQSRFSAWGVKKGTSINTRETRETHMLDTPSYGREMGVLERRSVAWSREMAVLRGDKLHEQKRAVGFFSQLYSLDNYAKELSREALNSGDMHKEVSMMDINRYQFRRTRPTTPGLPVISPGGELSSDRVHHGPGGN